jgi:hypothetical protein
MEREYGVFTFYSRSILHTVFKAVARVFASDDYLARPLAGESGKTFNNIDRKTTLFLRINIFHAFQ